jgi:DnaJ-class molecular chaperone
MTFRCRVCRGYRWVWENGWVLCPRCNGTGYVAQNDGSMS